MNIEANKAATIETVINAFAANLAKLGFTPHHAALAMHTVLRCDVEDQIAVALGRKNCNQLTGAELGVVWTTLAYNVTVAQKAAETAVTA
jgi:hypothetical protein